MGSRTALTINVKCSKCCNNSTDIGSITTENTRLPSGDASKGVVPWGAGWHLLDITCPWITAQPFLVSPSTEPPQCNPPFTAPTPKAAELPPPTAFGEGSCILSARQGPGSLTRLFALPPARLESLCPFLPH